MNTNGLTKIAKRQDRFAGDACKAGVDGIEANALARAAAQRELQFGANVGGLIRRCVFSSRGDRKGFLDRLFNRHSIVQANA